MSDPSTIINLQPIVDQVVMPFLGVLATGVATAAVGWVGYAAQKYLHVQITASTADRVNSALDRAVAYGQHTVGEMIDAHSTVDSKSAVVAAAVAYAEPKLQDEMKTLGWDPTTLAQRLTARLPLAPQNVLVSGVASLGSFDNTPLNPAPSAAAAPQEKST